MTGGIRLTVIYGQQRLAYCPDIGDNWFGTLFPDLQLFSEHFVRLSRLARHQSIGFWQSILMISTRGVWVLFY